MEALRENLALPRPPETGRWVLCVALALGVHAVAAAALLAHRNAAPDEVANAPPIMIDLEPLPVAPDAKPTEAPPGPLEQQATAAPATAKPVEPAKPLEKTAEAPPTPRQQELQTQPTPQQAADITSALPPSPHPEPVPAVLPPKPPERSVQKPAEKPVDRLAAKPVERKQRPARTSLASAPSPAEKRAARAAAPSPGTSSQNPNAVPTWKSELVARLERYKRYPAEAQARGEHGVAQLAFSVDRRGGVHHARIARSSGSSSLDTATMALIERAAPMPPPPPELAGTQIAISVPIRYDMR
jgi:protein TonB